jgi:hypothetical protein
MHLGCIHKIFNRVSSKAIPICFFAPWEVLIKVRVLLEGYPFLVLETAEIPEDFCHGRTISKHF